MGQYQPASQSATGMARPLLLQNWPAVHGMGAGEPTGQNSPGWHSPPLEVGWKRGEQSYSFGKQVIPFFSFKKSLLFLV